MGKKRKTFSGKEKATIALEALRERQTLSEIAQKYEVHPTRGHITGYYYKIYDFSLKRRSGCTL